MMYIYLAWSSPRWTGNHRFYVTRVPGPCVCVTIAFKTTVPSALALGASRTSNRSAGLADRGRWHRSRVHRVLVRAPRPRIHVCQTVLPRRLRASLWACMVHAWYVDDDSLRSQRCGTWIPVSSVWARSTYLVRVRRSTVKWQDQVPRERR